LTATRPSRAYHVASLAGPYGLNRDVPVAAGHSTVRTCAEVVVLRNARPLGEIREARAAKADSGCRALKVAGMVAELKELASMLDAALITREEFDRLKAKLLAR